MRRQHAFFYYTRPSKQKIMLAVALSPDPLFQVVTRIVELEPPLGDEKVIEKFESYVIAESRPSFADPFAHCGSNNCS